MPPLNRVVAFAGPYISLAAGALATYLFAKLNVLGVPGLTEGGLATDLTAVFSFGVTTLVTWLGHASWLKGHHIAMQQGVGLIDPPRPRKLKVRKVEGQLGSFTPASELVIPVAPDAFLSDPDMGEPLAAGPESYQADPRDKHGAQDHPS